MSSIAPPWRAVHPLPRVVLTRLLDRQLMPDDLGAEVFEPGEVFRDHVEFEPVAACFRRRAHGNLDADRLAGRDVAGQVSARVIPGQRLFTFRAEDVRDEMDRPLLRPRVVPAEPARKPRVLGADAEGQNLSGAADGRALFDRERRPEVADPATVRVSLTLAAGE